MKILLPACCLAFFVNSAFAQQTIVRPNNNTTFQKQPPSSGVTPPPGATSVETALLNDIVNMFANMRQSFELQIEKLKQDAKTGFEQFRQQARNKIVQNQQRIAWLNINIASLTLQKDPTRLRRDELKRDSLRNELNIAVIIAPHRVPVLRDSMAAVERRINAFLADIPRISSLIVQYNNEKQQLHNEIGSLEAQITANAKNMEAKVSSLDKSKQQNLAELDKEKQKAIAQVTKLIEEKKAQELETLKRAIEQIINKYANILDNITQLSR